MVHTNIHTELEMAVQADVPTHFKGILDQGAVTACREVFVNEDELAARAFELGRLFMYDKNFARTGSKVIYPTDINELATLRAQESYKGFAVTSVESLSAAVNGLKIVFEKLFAPQVVLAGAYISPADNAVLPPHNDGEPVIAVQLKGRKRFDFPTLGESEFGATLDPGDGLVIPQGLVHSTATLVDSVHLCFNLLPPDFFDDTQ